MPEQKEKVVYVMVKKDTGEDERKKKQRTTLIVGAMFFGIVDIVLAVIFIPKLFGNTSNGYRMSDITIDRYNNVVNYINQQRGDLGLSTDMTDIVALTFKDHNLCVSYQNETEPGYMSITMPDIDSVSGALDVFNGGAPSVGAYEYVIQVETFNTSKEIDIQSPLLKGHIANYGLNDYLSCTYQYDETTLCSMTNVNLNSDTREIASVTESECKPLYDMWYYILHK